MQYWTGRTELPCGMLSSWAGIKANKYATWQNRYGHANEHSSKVPHDWWIEAWEKQAILDHHERHPLEGYRRLTFMMLGW